MWRLFPLKKLIPSDIIPRDGIIINEQAHTVSVDVSKVQIPLRHKPKIQVNPIAATGSMRPGMGKGNNVVCIIPKPDDKTILCDWLEEQCKKGFGNTIVYYLNGKYICHRIVEVHHDHSRYFVTAGDNNIFLGIVLKDKWEIRDAMIHSLVVANVS